MRNRNYCVEKVSNGYKALSLVLSEKIHPIDFANVRLNYHHLI